MWKKIKWVILSVLGVLITILTLGYKKPQTTRKSKKEIEEIIKDDDKKIQEVGKDEKKITNPDDASKFIDNILGSNSNNE